MRNVLVYAVSKMKAHTQGRLLLLLGFIRLAATGNEKFISLTPGLVRRSESACQGMAEKPFFNAESVIGKPWRVYYMWNVKLSDQCTDIHFQKATPAIIRRIHYDMSRSVSEQPNWEEATLLMTMGRSRLEMLLIPDKQIPGRFIAVPNDFRDVMPGGIVPLLKFQMKLLRKWKFLVFYDCLVGIGSISARFDEPPFRMDIDSAALEMAPYFGDGNHVCVNEKNLLEYVVDSTHSETKKPALFF